MPISLRGFRRLMWRLAGFSGVEILTYALMASHFHILVKVPERAEFLKRFEGEGGEERLLEHLSLLYSKAYLVSLRQEIARVREAGREEEVQLILDAFRRRFCDLSCFVKELKERFSRWFNKHHDRRGTLWMERFKSVLVEDGEALRTMALYIDLNPVRAGLLEDPKDLPLDRLRRGERREQGLRGRSVQRVPGLFRSEVQDRGTKGPGGCGGEPSCTSGTAGGRGRVR